MVPTRTQYSLTQRQPVAGNQAADASRRRHQSAHSGHRTRHGMPTAHGRTACGHTSRKRRPTRAPQCSRGAAHPRAPWRVREATTPSPPHIHRRHAPPRDRARASLRHRDDVSTSAPMPPPARSAAAEPPVACAMQLHGLTVPATQRETTRSPTNDRRRRPADSRTPRAVRIGEVTCGGGAAAGTARAWLSRVYLQETASARIFRQCKAADRRRWHATGGRRGQERAALQWSKQRKIAECEAKRQRRRATH